jgi:hypothetical protein
MTVTTDATEYVGVSARERPSSITCSIISSYIKKPFIEKKKRGSLLIPQKWGAADGIQRKEKRSILAALRECFFVLYD